MPNQLRKKILKEIESLAKKINRLVYLMEVCGTHTQTVARYGIRNLMPKNIKLISGPGCPVCVTAQEDIDAVVHLALSGIPIACYGDVLRVPGCKGSLDQARGQGARVKEVYSIEEALVRQKEEPDLVFFGIGFETTAPMTALAIKRGLIVYSAHKLFLPAMEALLKLGEIKIDGFICPGHVSTIIGSKPYQKFGAPQVISGFEPEDVLVSICLLLRQIAEGRAEVENEYIRSVKPAGNPQAQKLLSEVFDIKEAHWRGFGIIPQSGLEIKKEYQACDAKVKHRKILAQFDYSKSRPIKGCCCSEIIRGLKKSSDCPLFKKVCTPENPQGPCMVSLEGACNVSFRYGC
jgi:hydrogenase expression/formation protein HypD